jgi:hypothetical protein
VGAGHAGGLERHQHFIGAGSDRGTGEPRGKSDGWARVSFSASDDFWRDYRMLESRNVVFVREPKEESYGTVAVFRDLYGNLWDLIQRKT